MSTLHEKQQQFQADLLKLVKDFIASTNNTQTHFALEVLDNYQKGYPLPNNYELYKDGIRCSDQLETSQGASGAYLVCCKCGDDVSTGVSYVRYPNGSTAHKTCAEEAEIQRRSAQCDKLSRP